MERIGTPKSRAELELMASIHDAMTFGHGRIYKRLGWWVGEMFPGQLDFRIRISDVENSGEGNTVIVYQNTMTSTSILPADSVNLLATNGHIRFLLPSKEAYAGPWGRWHNSVTTVRELDWSSRGEALETDDGRYQ